MTWPRMQLSGKVLPTDGWNSKFKDPKKGPCSLNEKRGSFTGYSDPVGLR